MKKKNSEERLETVKRKQRNFLVAIGILAFVAISIFIGFKIMDPDEVDDDLEYQPTLASGSDVIINSSEITSDDFHYYSQNIDGVKVKYFIVADEEGEIHVAFNACEVCYDAKKGYVQDGDSAQCRNCGRTFPVEGLGTENADGGGCWPGNLPYTMDGNDIKIKITDLEKGKYLFE